MLLFMALASHSQAQNIKENILAGFITANAEGPTQAEIDKKDEIESNRRVTQIDNLLNDIGGGHSTSQEFNAALSGTNVILLESTLYVTEDYSGDIKILGELQNTGNSDVSFVKITYTFKDSSDDIIDTDYTYIHGSTKNLAVVSTDTILSPSEVGFFRLYTDIPYDLVNSFYYNISYENYETHPMKSEVVLHGNIIERPDYFGFMELLGELKNLRGATGYFVQFVAAVKNVNGQVIGIGSSFINGRTVELESGITTDTALSPAEVASFEVRTIAMYSDAEAITYKINWDEGGVANAQPLANCGDDQRVRPGQKVSLDGTGSYDPNGVTLSYLWTQLSGPIVPLSNPRSPTPDFFAPKKSATIVFDLNVSNGTGQSSMDSITVFVLSGATLPSMLLLLDKRF